MAIAGALHGLRTRGGFNVDIKLEGDWVRYDALFNRFGPTMVAIARSAQHSFAEKYKDRVKHHILTGGTRFGYPGHSAKYSSYKSSRGGPSRVLYWSGAMMRAVEIMKLPGGRVGVGIPRDATRNRYPREGGDLLTISEYANILENGTMGGLHIPARPVFRDTFKQDMKGMKGLRQFMTAEILIQARALGINISRI